MTWTYGGVDLDSAPYTVINYGGFGSIRPDIQETLLAGRDGSEALNVQRGGREAFLEVLVAGNSLDVVVAAMDRLRALPEGNLTREREDGRTFIMPQSRIVSGLADDPRDAINGTFQRQVTLTFRSDHPNLIDPNPRLIELPASRLIFDNPFPWRMPKRLSDGRLGVLFEISYAGDADTHSIVLTVPGPARNPSLVNLSDPLGSSIRFSRNVLPGETFAVNLDDIPNTLPLLSAGAPPFLLAGQTANQLLYSHEGADIPGQNIRIGYFDEYLGS